jgi:large subunit ribosomal protein L19
MKAKKYTKETIKNVGILDRGFPTFKVGDTITVNQKIVEKVVEKGVATQKTRIQAFEGDVIAYHNNGISTTFTIRRIGVHGVPVERIFPYFSPLIDSIRLIRKGEVRRAKLYYLRERVGKSARIKEKMLHEREEAPVQEQAPAQKESTQQQ